MKESKQQVFIEGTATKVNENKGNENHQEGEEEEVISSKNKSH